MLLFVAYNYLSNSRNTIISAIFFYSFAILTEIIAFVMLREMGIINNSFPFENAGFVLGRLISEILLFLIVLLFSNIKQARKNIDIPLNYWIACTFVPIATLIPTLFAMFTQNRTLYAIVTSTIGLLSIVVFFGYLSNKVNHFVTKI